MEINQLIKFQPILKDKIWGGEKLKNVLNKESDRKDVGESWEISDVKGDTSVVINGDLKGKNLQQLISEFKADLVGEKIYKHFGDKFPLLIKFIDAKEALSIQLHPHDNLAKKRHNSFGKTEMWYVMDANKGANLIVGFNKDVTKDEYAKSIENDTLLDLMNYETVSEGDTFFINTGKIHAIGAGVLLAEIQQTSDVTYRVFDFNRRDKNGNLRELHTEQALDAIDYEKKDDFKVGYNDTKDSVNTMVDCPYFKTNFIELTQDLDQNVSQRDSFTIYMCVGGKAVISNENGEAAIHKGETILVPAISNSIKITSSGAKLLEVTI